MAAYHCPEDHQISTHSPARGLTAVAAALSPVQSYFNSQPRKGADGSAWDIHSLCHISTHSPARGLTDSFRQDVLKEKFQLTAPQGG